MLFYLFIHLFCENENVKKYIVIIHLELERKISEFIY